MPTPAVARRTSVAALGLSAALVLAGCSSTDDAAADSTGDDSTISVVASTDVYGDIAEQVAGGKVEVTSIVNSATQDPHSYEATANDELTLSKATLVIENGGGYDEFVEKLLDDSDTKADVVNVVDLSGKKAPTGGELNEHVWYDFPTVTKLADDLATRLVAADPANATAYSDNAKAFTDKVAALEGRLAKLKTTYSGEGVAVTEPVPLYLLTAAGLDNKTPAEFSAAIEEETDVPPDVLAETLALFSDKQVVLLAYNDQVTDATTEKVAEAAKDNGVAVVSVTETLPEGKDYLTWMSDNVTAVEEALSQ